jgi:hypothetical protein
LEADFDAALEPKGDILPRPTFKSNFLLIPKALAPEKLVTAKARVIAAMKVRVSFIFVY